MAGDFMVCRGNKADCFGPISGDNSMTAQALPKTEELSNTLIEFFFKKRKLKEFTIRQLKRDAGRLKGKIEPYIYHNLLGQIASLENNKTSLINDYEYALKLAPDDYDTQYNYIASLGNRGFITEAVAQTQILYKNFPNKLETLELLIKYIYLSCRFNEASQLLNKLKSPAEYFAYDIIVEALTIFENAGLTEDEAQYLCELAYSVLNTQNLYFSGAEIEIIGDCVHYSIYVDLPLDAIFDVNWELAGVFVDNVENRRNGTFIFEYKSVDILEERQVDECVV